MWIGGVRVIILDDKKRILMVRQHHEGRDIWMVPGGGIEDGETAVQAALREMKEETFLEVEIDKLIWHVEEVSEKRGQRFVNFFLGHIVDGIPSLGKDPEFDEEHQVLRQLKFMSKEELAQVKHLYPEYLKDEIWEFIEKDLKGYNAYKDRESLHTI